MCSHTEAGCDFISGVIWKEPVFCHSDSPSFADIMTMEGQPTEKPIALFLYSAVSTPSFSLSVIASAMSLLFSIILYYKDIVKERVHDNEKIIIVSPSGGINANFFYPKRFNRDNRGIYHLGYVGRIDPCKGWREFIEALYRLPNEFNYRATIIGYGSEVEYLKEYLRRDERHRIDYMPKVAHEELRNYYSQFDILLFPSMRKEESLGLVGIEAMACGTPIIGSNIGGIPSYLTHKETGYLIEPGDIEQITKYIIEYSQLDEEKKESYYKNCITTSKLYYSEKVLKDLAESFRALFDKDCN